MAHTKFVNHMINALAAESKAIKKDLLTNGHTMSNEEFSLEFTRWENKEAQLLRLLSL